MREMESHLVISCHQLKLPVLRLGYVQLGCWPKGSHGNSQAIHAIAKTVGCSLQTDSKAHRWRQHPHNLLVMDGQASTYIEPSPLQSNVFGTRRYSVGYQKRNTKPTQPQNTGRYIREAGTTRRRKLFLKPQMLSDNILSFCGWKLVVC